MFAHILYNEKPNLGKKAAEGKIMNFSKEFETAKRLNFKGGG